MGKRVYITESQYYQLLHDYSNSKHYDSAAAYVFGRNQNGEVCILTVRRGSGAPTNGGMRTVPMGYCEISDATPFETAIREVFEETGVILNGCQQIDGGDERWGNKGQIGKNCVFRYKNPLNSNFQGDGENEDIQWTPLSQLGQYQWGWGMDKTILTLYNLAK